MTSGILTRTRTRTRRTGRSGGRRCWASGGAFALSVASLAVGISLAAPTTAGADPVQTPDGSVTVGNTHACAVTTGGAAQCWGQGTSGSLGNGTSTRSVVPVAVSGLSSGVASIEAGNDATCAVTTTGAAWCWGENLSGALGNGTTTNSAVPSPVSGLSSGVVAISTSGFTTPGLPAFSIPKRVTAHTCAVTSSGGVKCWGTNSSGELGNGTTTRSLTPVDVTGLGPGSGVTAVSVGYEHSCASLASGSVMCWGKNDNGQLGDGSTANSSVPVSVSGLSGGASSLSAGNQHTCVVAGSAVRCWGLNSTGQLGNGTTTSSSVPVASVGLSDAVEVTAGATHSCAIRSSGALWCWSTGGIALGGGTLASALTPVAVPSLTTGVVAAAAGLSNSCVLMSTGAVMCWGTNDSGQIGRGLEPSLSNGTRVPTPVEGLGSQPATSIGVGRSFSCALIEEGVSCWGKDDAGQLGDGQSKSRVEPAPVSGLASGVASLSVGRDHACVVTTAGGVKCWGVNDQGQLGVGSLVNASVPVDVVGLGSGVAAVSVGDTHACALTTGGAVKCWGNGIYGQLGVGTTADSSVPVDVIGLPSGVVAVGAGGQFSCALVAGGGMKCWGDNGSRQLGSPSTTARYLTPIDVVGHTSGVASFSLGSDHACAVTVAGGAQCWGSNSYDQLGHPSTASTSDVVGLESGVVSMAASSTYTCAVRAAAGPKCWGYYIDGVTDPGGPAADATAIAGSDSHRCVISPSAGIACWGSNGSGQLGSPSDNWIPGAVVGGSTYGPDSVSGPVIIGARTPAPNSAGWNNEPVTVSFTCSSLALASCTAPSTVDADGADQSVSGEATDLYQQTSSTTVSGISIDRVAPTLTGLATAPPNGAGWYRQPVTMVWTCEDGLSGIEAGACPTSSTTVGEGTAVSTAASVSDRAGNQATASSESVQVDLTAPSTGASSPATWSNADVTLTLTPTDGLSGVATTSYAVDGGGVQSGLAPLVSGQGTHTVEFWSTDVAGNEEAHQTVQVHIDVEAPSITAERSVPSNANGWNNGPVAITFTCSSDGAPLESCTGDRAFDAEVDTSVTGTARDVAGNTASVQEPVRIDLTPPVVDALVPAANANGWFNAEVQVPFSCTDSGGSGVATCPAPAMFAGDGADQPVTAVGSDAAGNSGTASGDSVSIDTAAPTISGAAVTDSNGDGGFYGDVTIHWTCADGLSGVASCPADQVVSGEGTHTVLGSVSDRAGNTSSAEVTIRIDHDPADDPGIIHGTITDAVTHQPVAGALVRLYSPDVTQAVRYSATTATDGTYSFPLVDDGSYWLSAKKDGSYLPMWDAVGGAKRVLEVEHGTNLTVDHTLSPGHVLSGTITAAGTGQPISGATVRLSPGTSTVTDASGHYELTGLIPTEFTLTVIAYGYAPDATTVAVPAVLTADRALLAAPSGGALKGTITTNLPGGPLAGAKVVLYPENGKAAASSVVTGADGRFQFPDLPAGNYLVQAGKTYYPLRWAGDVIDRPRATVARVDGTCTSTPDLSWGDPCARPMDIVLRRL